MSDISRTIVGTTGGVIMVGGIAWAASWYFATGSPSAWRLLPAAVMFVLGLAGLLWSIRRRNPSELVLARLNALIERGSELLFHGNSPAFDVRYRDWLAAVSGLLVQAFDDSVVASLTTGHPGLQAPQALVVSAFERQLDQLTIIRDQFRTGEIKAKIKKDSWYSWS
jgi:hypothetical protein